MQEGWLGFACDACCDHDPDHGWCAPIGDVSAGSSRATLARIIAEANRNLYRLTQEGNTLRRQVDELHRVREKMAKTLYDRLSQTEAERDEARARVVEQAVSMALVQAARCPVCGIDTDVEYNKPRGDDCFHNRRALCCGVLLTHDGFCRCDAGEPE
jgi:hypothetical protein